ncbi:MAG: hypothetical protein ACXACP_02145 [Candidatus Hodarchaeales archaeon]|jgi:hypothetical protein
MWFETRSWLETTRKWVYFSAIISFLAIVVHTAGQTGGYQHGYWEEPNLYDTWPRFDEVTHPLSSLAITAIILNLNLPMTYRKKWIVALSLGMFLGVLWEIMEALAPLGFFHISPTDTLLDFHQDFYGSALAVLLYTIHMRGNEPLDLTKFRM